LQTLPGNLKETSDFVSCWDVAIEVCTVTIVCDWARQC